MGIACFQWPTSLITLSNGNGVFNPFLLQFGVSLKVCGVLWQRAAVCPWCPCKKWQFYGGKRIPTLLWPLHHPIPTPPHITTSPVFPFWLLSCWGESTLVRNLPLDPEHQCHNDATRCEVSTNPEISILILWRWRIYQFEVEPGKGCWSIFLVCVNLWSIKFAISLLCNPDSTFPEVGWKRCRTGG